VVFFYPKLFVTDLKFVSDNLISLCSKCHDKMHDRTNNKLTKFGEQWVIRMSGNK